MRDYSGKGKRLRKIGMSTEKISLKFKNLIKETSTLDKENINGAQKLLTENIKQNLTFDLQNPEDVKTKTSKT